MNYFIVLISSSESANIETSPLYHSASEAEKFLKEKYDSLINSFAANLNLDVGNYYFKNNCFRVSAGERTFWGFVRMLEAPSNENITSANVANIEHEPAYQGPQTVIFGGNSAIEVQEQANAFLKEHPGIEIIDSELSTTLETTSVTHYFRVTYALIYKEE